MKKIFSLAVISLIVIGMLSNCKEDNYQKLRDKELKMLKEYLKKNYPNLKPKPSGLYFIEVEPGVGDSIKVGDKVQIYYATYKIDSMLIDESSGYTDGHRFEPLEFVVDPNQKNVIEGLKEAVTYMKKGGKAKLIIPSELAYRDNASSGVPIFTTLLMEVEIYKVYHYKDK